MPPHTPFKIVLDTNVFISAVLWTGVPHQLLELLEQNYLVCYTTIEILQELSEVLARQQFRKRIEELATSPQELMLGILGLVRVIRKSGAYNLRPNELPEDEDDIMFLECALAAGADYIVSGDPHLLQLKRIRDIHILSPAQFLELFKAEQGWS